MRIIIKRWISSVIYLFKKHWFRYSEKGKHFRILLYHCIGVPDKKDYLNIRVSLKDFHEQIKFLSKEGYNVMLLKELIYKIKNKEQVPDRAVAITFDDGYSENLTEVLDILKQYNCPATFFVTTDYMESGKNLQEKYWEYWDFFNLEDLKKIIQSGSDIGAHSCSHPDLSVLSDNLAEKEISGSKRILESMLNVNVDLFSYPHGKFNERIKKIAERSGYQAACSSITGKNDPDADLYALKRICIDGRDGIFDFEKKIKGCYDCFGIVRRK